LEPNRCAGSGRASAHDRGRVTDQRAGEQFVKTLGAIVVDDDQRRHARRLPGELELVEGTPVSFEELADPHLITRTDEPQADARAIGKGVVAGEESPGIKAC